MDKKDSALRLKDRNLLLVGPNSSLTQSIAKVFSELGANIAFLSQNITQLARFSEQINDAREMNDNFGRACAVQANLIEPASCREGVSKVAEAFGGIDIYIDANQFFWCKPFRQWNQLGEVRPLLQNNMEVPLQVTHAVLKFLEGKKRGRIIYLLQSLATRAPLGLSLTALSRNGLEAFSKSLAEEMLPHSVTVNCLSLGLTEELALAYGGPEANTLQKSELLLREKIPGVHLVDNDRVAQALVFLASPLGAGITGQTLLADHL